MGEAYPCPVRILAGTPSRLPIPHICCHNSPMKRILAPILLLVFLFPSLAPGETWDDLVQGDGLFYENFSVVPFTGKTTGNVQGTFRNGKKHGPWVTYHPDGEIESKGTFKNGKKDGPWARYYENGQLSLACQSI